MKRFLQEFCSRRWGHDGWALRVKGTKDPLGWSVCTTREEARELRQEAFPEMDFFDRTEVVKVRIKLEVVR